MIRRLLARLRHNPRLTRRATEALIRQEMDMHPVERDYPDDKRVRDIRKTLAASGEEATDDAVNTQFKYETGRDWKVARSSERADPAASRPTCGRGTYTRGW